MAISCNHRPMCNVRFYDGPTEKTYDINRVVYNGDTVWERWKGLSFTFEKAGTTLTFGWFEDETRVVLEISTDNGETWSEWERKAGEYSYVSTFTSTGAGQRICIRGDNETITENPFAYHSFYADGNVAASGNIQSLIGFSDSVPPYCFYRLFDQESEVRPTSDPWLTSAPELPATTVGEGCYACMFYECTALSAAPDLPAVSTTDSCYDQMFAKSSVTSLKTSQTSKEGLSDWLYGVETTGVLECPSELAVKLTPGEDYPSTWTVVKTDEDFLKVTFEKAGTSLYLSRMGKRDLGVTIYVSVDDGETWTEWEEEDSWRRSLTAERDGQTVLLRGSNERLANGRANDPTRSYHSFSATGKFSCSGSVHALCGGSSSIPDFCYVRLFFGCPWLTKAPDIVSGAFGSCCCNDMFAECTGLVHPPDKVSGTSAGSECFASAFQGCTSLTSAPTLSFDRLDGTECCLSMFSGCSALTSVPDITVLSVGALCFRSAFSYCTALESAPKLEVGSVLGATNCFLEMFLCCTKLASVPRLKVDGDLSDSCCKRMFAYCTALATAPAIEVSGSLAAECFCEMFFGCASLENAPSLPFTTVCPACYRRMFEGCTSLTTAPSLPAAVLAGGTWSTEDGESHGTYGCYYRMFYGCSSLSSVTTKQSSFADPDTGGWSVVSGCTTTPGNSSWLYGTGGGVFHCTPALKSKLDNLEFKYDSYVKVTVSPGGETRVQHTDLTPLQTNSILVPSQWTVVPDVI